VARIRTLAGVGRVAVAVLVDPVRKLLLAGIARVAIVVGVDAEALPIVEQPVLVVSPSTRRIATASLKSPSPRSTSSSHSSLYARLSSVASPSNISVTRMWSSPSEFALGSLDHVKVPLPVVATSWKRNSVFAANVPRATRVPTRLARVSNRNRFWGAFRDPEFVKAASSNANSTLTAPAVGMVTLDASAEVVAGPRSTVTRPLTP